MKRLALAALLLISGCAHGQLTVSNLTTGGNGVIGNYLTAPTPQMGWSTWPGLSCPTCYNGGSFIPPTEALVEAQAVKLADPALSGLCAVEYAPNGGPCVSLTALGYRLVAIDAGWDECVSGSPPCIFQPIAAQFPDGISGVASYVHARSQLLGLYGSPGLVDCVNYPAQYQHEADDIALVASWGVDEFRSDWCPSAQSIYGSSSAAQQGAFQLIGTALRSAGRPIGFDVNDANTFTSSWFQVVGGTRVRIGIDNAGGTWYGKAQGDLSFATPYQAKGHWLDFDILMGGLSENDETQAVSDAEARAQFNWHAIVASPLIIGNVIENLDSANLTTYANSEVIAVDQDALGKMGSKVAQTTCGTTVCQVWMRPLANGDYAVALLNFDPSATHTVAVNWSDFSQSGTFNIRDLWAHAGAGSSSTGYSVSLPAWGSALIRLSR